MLRKSPLHRRSPAREHTHSRGDRQQGKSHPRDGPRLRIKGHPQPARSKQQQNDPGRHLPHRPMPFRKLPSKRFVNQNQPQNQRHRAGKNMRIERPLVSARKIGLPPAQEINVEIGRKVIAIPKHYANSDLENQHDRQKQQSALQIREAKVLHVAPFNSEEYQSKTRASAARKRPIVAGLSEAATSAYPRGSLDDRVLIGGTSL